MFKFAPRQLLVWTCGFGTDPWLLLMRHGKPPPENVHPANPKQNPREEVEYEKPIKTCDKTRKHEILKPAVGGKLKSEALQVLLGRHLQPWG